MASSDIDGALGRDSGTVTPAEIEAVKSFKENSKNKYVINTGRPPYDLKIIDSLKEYVDYYSVFNGGHYMIKI